MKSLNFNTGGTKLFYQNRRHASPIPPLDPTPGESDYPKTNMLSLCPHHQGFTAGVLMLPDTGLATWKSEPFDWIRAESFPEEVGLRSHDLISSLHWFQSVLYGSPSTSISTETWRSQQGAISLILLPQNSHSLIPGLQNKQQRHS